MAYISKADFNDESFSDVKIEIYTGVDDQSDRRSFYCHKLVLKKDSEVFATAFNKNSRFADANSAVYKVFEEDLDGIEAYLKGRYGIAPSNAETADWEFMLKLAHIASKYGNSKAAREYWDDFRAAFKKAWDNTRPTAPKQAEEMLKKLLLCEDVAFEEWNGTTSKGLPELVGLRYVRNNHNGLMKDDDFYEWISGHPRLWRKCLAAFTAVYVHICPDRCEGGLRKGLQGDGSDLERRCPVCSTRMNKKTIQVATADVADFMVDPSEVVVDSRGVVQGDGSIELED